MEKNLYSQDIHLKDIRGNDVALENYRGKVLLIVNTASECGFTPQYANLQEIYQKYHDRGFEVLAFPANDFGKQEPGTDEEIEKFCNLTYKIDFPLFSKICVKGKDMHPLYRYLTEHSKFKGSIKWNFTKFLIDRNGQITAKYSSLKSPSSAKVRRQIEKLLDDEQR